MGRSPGNTVEWEKEQVAKQSAHAPVYSAINTVRQNMHIHAPDAQNISEHSRKDEEEALAVVTSGPCPGEGGGGRK